MLGPDSVRRIEPRSKRKLAVLAERVISAVRRVEIVEGFPPSARTSVQGKMNKASLRWLNRSPPLLHIARPSPYEQSKSGQSRMFGLTMLTKSSPAKWNLQPVSRRVYLAACLSSTSASNDQRNMRRTLTGERMLLSLCHPRTCPRLP